VEIRRPDGVLLLQPWSTATIQTTNSRMALTARVLSHIVGTPFADSLEWFTSGGKDEDHCLE
jgi:hypothetical protein